MTNKPPLIIPIRFSSEGIWACWAIRKVREYAGAGDVGVAVGAVEALGVDAASADVEGSGCRTTGGLLLGFPFLCLSEE